MSSILGTEFRPSGLVVSILPTKHLSLFIFCFHYFTRYSLSSTYTASSGSTIGKQWKSWNKNWEGTWQGGTLICNIQEWLMDNTEQNRSSTDVTSQRITNHPRHLQLCEEVSRGKCDAQRRSPGDANSSSEKPATVYMTTCRLPVLHLSFV